MTDTAHIIGACANEWDPPTVVEGENSKLQQQQPLAAQCACVRRCEYKLLTSCYVPCVPSSEKERKHSSHEQGSLILHTSLGHVEKEWDSPTVVEGENSNL